MSARLSDVCAMLRAVTWRVSFSGHAPEVSTGIDDMESIIG